MAMEVVGTAPVRTASWRHAGLLMIGLGALAALLRAFDPSSIAGVQSFFIVFSSLLIEAVPFILLGATVSAAIAILVPAAAFERVAGLPPALQLPAAGLAGFAFPVCECGSVPVARRLASRGLSPAAAVTFMLAAPIVNPVVLASTLVAYRGRDVMWAMVAGRAGLGFLVALAVGWTVSGLNVTQLGPLPTVLKRKSTHSRAALASAGVAFGLIMKASPPLSDALASGKPAMP